MADAAIFDPTNSGRRAKRAIQAQRLEEQRRNYEWPQGTTKKLRMEGITSGRYYEWKVLRMEGILYITLWGYSEVITNGCSWVSKPNLWRALLRAIPSEHVKIIVGLCLEGFGCRSSLNIAEECSKRIVKIGANTCLPTTCFR